MGTIRLKNRCSPVSLSLLGSLPERYLHHFEYELRHPLGIYRNALNEVACQFNSVFEKLEQLECEYQSGKDTGKFKELLVVYERLLYRLREFIDDCYLILQGIAPVNEKYLSKTIFTNQYLAKIKFPGFRSFERKIEPYKKYHVGAIVNALKHKQRTLRGIFFYSRAQEDLFIPGYYVEGISRNGALAPCRSVHHDENSAFSFNRDIRLHVWHLFSIDSALNEAIAAAIDAWKIEVNKSAPVNNEIDFSMIIKKAESLLNRFYFDEYKKPTVHFECSHEGCMLDYPGKKVALNLPMNVSIVAMPEVDMTIPNIALPYFRR